MTFIRTSPSGPLEAAGGGDVLSVYGRTGDVVAEFGDYDTDLLPNASPVPGVTVTEALDALRASAVITNESDVEGDTLPTALDHLLNRTPLGRGALRDTFQGGNGSSVTASSTSAAIGDLGWNFAEFGGNGASAAPGGPLEDGVGICRLTSTNTASGSGASIYIGRSDGLVSETGWQSFVFRVQPNASAFAGEINQWGLTSNPAQSMLLGESAGFFVEPSASPNYHVFTASGGTVNAIDTGVAITAGLHDFQVLRLDQDGLPLLSFFIDGALVANIGETLPVGPLVPCVVALQGTFGCTIDVDDFLLVPVAA